MSVVEQEQHPVAPSPEVIKPEVIKYNPRHTRSAVWQASKKLSLLACPFMLWWIGTLFFFGNIGIQQDDWFYILRNPETQRIESLVLSQPMHFFRPLYRIVVPVIWTVFAYHEWAAHVIAAVVHGLCALSVFRLCVALGAEKLSSMAASLFYLLYPVHEQAFLWPTAMPTTLGVLLAIEWLRVVAIESRGGDAHGLSLLWCPSHRYRRARLCAGLLLAAFAIASLNEQPAALLLAAPLICIALSSSGMRQRCVRAIAIGVAVVGGLVAYICMHSLHCEPIQSGNGSAVPLDRTGERGAELLGQIAHFLSLKEFAAGAWDTGIDSIKDHWARSIALLAFLVVALPAWWSRLYQRPVGHRCSDAIVLVLIGSSMVFLSWLPIVRFWYYMSSRIHAPGVAGLSVCIAGAGTMLTLAPWGRVYPYARNGAIGSLCIASLYCSVLLVGTQRAYIERWNRDLRELDGLRTLVPNPEPGTVFVPVHVAWAHPLTGSSRFDFDRRDVFISSWSATWAVQSIYRRSDITCAWNDWGPPPRCIDVVRDENGKVTQIHSRDGDIPVDRAVLFRVDSAGTVKLVPK